MVDKQLKLLNQGLSELGLNLSPEQAAQLLAYADLLIKWNKVYKLTAISQAREVLIQHLLDGLAVASTFAQAASILDVGSGMGVPGVILAIVYPTAKVVALDSNSKKCAFLRQVQIELKLTNFQVVNSRVEAYQPAVKFAAITSRAFASLSLFVSLAAHLLAEDGVFWAMKGEQGVVELADLASWRSQIIKLEVPFLAAQRFLIKISPK